MDECCWHIWHGFVEGTQQQYERTIHIMKSYQMPLSTAISSPYSRSWVRLRGHDEGDILFTSESYQLQDFRGLVECPTLSDYTIRCKCDSRTVHNTPSVKRDSSTSCSLNQYFVRSWWGLFLIPIRQMVDQELVHFSDKLYRCTSLSIWLTMFQRMDTLNVN